MPGKKQWYAMKARLQKEGRWKGRAVHKVPEREEGEPPEKSARADQDEGDRASDPEEGTSRVAQGKYICIYVL